MGDLGRGDGVLTRKRVDCGCEVGRRRLRPHQHDRAALTTGQECPPPPGPDAGIPGCQSCKECGNQACVNGTCGSCTSSAQCCGPLQCENGTCVLPAQ